MMSAISAVQDDILNIFPTQFKLGDNIGFQTSALTKKPIRGVIFMTTGTLLQQVKILTAERFINRYSFVILDEAHERSIELDIVMYFMRKLIIENYKDPRCPVLILMSATLDVDKFSKYFGMPKNPPEIITVRGISFPIKNVFRTEPSKRFILDIIQQVEELHKNVDDFTQFNRDILIFMPDVQNINRVMKGLEELNSRLTDKIFPIMLTGLIYAEGGKDIQMLEAPIETLTINGKPAMRKVIVATNVAETSVTIKSLRYVIDSGLRRSIEYDPNGYDVNMNKPITQSMAMQRRGRVGRVAEGLWYPMYTEKDFNSLLPMQFPSIITSDCTLNILSVIIRDGKFDLDNMEMMDNPPEEMVWASMERLYMLGCFSVDKNIVPTEMALLINKFRKLSIESIRMILCGYYFGSNIVNLITIAVFLEHNIREKGYKLRNPFKNEQRLTYLLDDTFIDLVLLLEEFRTVVKTMNMKRILKWCEDNSIDYNEFMYAINERDDIIEDMKAIIGLEPLYNGLDMIPSSYSLSNMLKSDVDLGIEEIIKMKKCIYEGYKLNLAVYLSEHNIYTSYYRGFKIDKPEKLTGTPRFFIYHNLMFTSITKKTSSRDFSVMDNFVTIDLNMQ